MSNQQPGWFPDPSDAKKMRWWDGNEWAVHVSRDGAVWEEPLVAKTIGLKRRSRWVWVLLALGLLVAVALLSPLVALVALVVLVTGIVGISKGSGTWLRLKSRRTAIGVTAGAALVFLMAGSVSAAMVPGETGAPTAVETAQSAEARSEATPRRTSTPTPTPVTTSREEVVTEVIPFERSTVEDANIARGETTISVSGQDGERTITYVVTVVDGVETGRELKSDVETVAPVTEVTTVGTYDAPPEPAPPAEPTCDSNYADACVPIASDVDCAWGSGNGPAYFDGVAKVVGRDIYGLDRDGDGLACER
ncbi:hypothetical protein FHX49_000524 [Microbacterium endophyticum]|uniref:G5 domain-containing protein n=1 Tax=Microbacterium endophyticum TaxID=1526412 RepID=A0A7W4V179_9MICO|nr:G5 domain-containing protein [Microbacterium endophyticum]MBB2974983.1 hypothetical protein [Microbacterium endophyticum]NIK37280.1 hypothetical protein [Microbacterium endophyticum]